MHGKENDKETLPSKGMDVKEIQLLVFFPLASDRETNNASSDSGEEITISELTMHVEIVPKSTRGWSRSYSHREPPFQ